MKTIKRIKSNFEGIPSGRVEWCDVYKGILILLVVIGHCTGRFNQWIYQFHMAAFFMVSGFTSKKENGLFDYVIKRFCQLMIPYYGIGFVGISFFELAYKAKILPKISSTGYPDKFIDAVISLFNGSALYCDYLGAMWFLPVLFISSIFLQILIHLFKKDRFILVTSVLLFLYFISLEAFGSFFIIKLAGMAQLFLVYGYLLKKRIGTQKIRIGYSIIVIVIAAIVWSLSWYFGLKNTVDWPSNTFNGWSDMLLPIPGIFFCIGLSLLLTNCLPIKSFFSFLGVNSMGIMCFHLAGFKIAYFILILTDNMKWGDFHLLTPGFTEMDWKSLLVVFTSILFSILLWNFLNKTKFSLILGKSVYFETFICNVELLQNLKAVFRTFSKAIQQSILNLKDYFKKLPHKRILYSFIFINIILLLCIKAWSYWRPINVKFPYLDNTVVFVSGWLPQNTGEAYRWIGKKSVFKTFITDQDTLSIAGYIPEGINNITYYKIKVNDKEIYYSIAQDNLPIDVQKLDISNYVNHYSINKFEIELDGERTVSPSDLDQRVFSALIDSIVIE